MKSRSTSRFGIALVCCMAAGDLGLSPAIEAGARLGGWWGVVPALTLLGFGLALVFSVLYDGPRAVLHGLVCQYRRDARALR